MFKLKYNVKYNNFYLYIILNIKRQLKSINNVVKIHILMHIKIWYDLFKLLNYACNIAYI